MDSLCFPLPSALDLLLYRTAFPSGRLLCWDREEGSLRNLDKRSSFQCPVYRNTWLSLLKQFSPPELLNRSFQTVVCMHKCRFLWLAGNEWEKGERRGKILAFKNEESSWLSTNFQGLHSALLRLLATNYPHLCIVDDWICEEEITGTDALLRRMLLTNNAKNHSPEQLQEGTVNR